MEHQEDQVILDPINREESDAAGLHDHGSVGELVSFEELSEVRFELEQIAFDDASSDQDAMKATSKAMSLVKDYLNDLQLSGPLPSHLQRILVTTVNQITKAEKHMKEAEKFVSQYSGLAETNLEKASKVPPHNRKLLSSRKQSLNDPKSPKKYHFNSGASKADYHYRTKNRHLVHGYHGLGNHLSYQSHHQQGYRNARVSREEGTITHRRLQDDTNVCLPASRDDRKAEQCLRLAICAAEYSLYDMYAFFFADDFDFDTGEVDETVRVFDEKDIKGKVRIF